MRICLVYDCLFPHTVGGAERWYRSLAERLVSDGHEVTYLTLRQWDRGEAAGFAGVEVRSVGPRMRLYTQPGRRRILPPVIFGAGVLLHLLRHGRRYDVVHTASFPYFSLLAAAIARPIAGFRLVVDWHEVWTNAYWREYLGSVGGWIGWLVQQLCVRVPQRALCFSALHAARLVAEGFVGEVVTLPGEYDGPRDVVPTLEAEPLVVFAGRHIPEKQVPAIPPAIALAVADVPGLRATLAGNGPDKQLVEQVVASLGLQDTIEVPGFVTSEELEDLLAQSMCMLLPSRREGYGRIVFEAASHGTPSIVVADADNAAVALVSDGENGIIAPSASAEDLAEAITRVYRAGRALRVSTARWFTTNAETCSVDASLDFVVDAYRTRAAPGAQ